MSAENRFINELLELSNILILKGHPKLIIAEFRVAIEAYEFPRVGQVTISLGVTQILEQDAIASDIVGRADQALYYAKENGRNKLFSYENLIAEGILEETIDEGDIELF